MMKKLLLFLPIVMIFAAGALAQSNSQIDKEAAGQDTKTEKQPQKKTRKRVSDFKIYAGISTSKMLLSDSQFESAYAAGYLLGIAYRKGRFAYWEVGVNYNNSTVALNDISLLKENLQIRQLDVPLSGGINVLSLTRRVLGVRLFGGLVPGYIAGIGDNPFDLDKDNFNRFQLGGRMGFGVDVLFLFIEGGYQYGFIDVLKEQGSNISQLDLRLGFRF